MKISREFLAVIVVALVLCFLGGALLGRNGYFGGRFFNKVDTVMALVDRYYVDSVSEGDLQEKTIRSMLAQLDPHSVYLDSTEAALSSQGLLGSFSGIGVQFNTLLDTPVVVHVIPGGPSERAGLQAGDRLLRADDRSLVGLATDSIMFSLKGAKHSVVALELMRGDSVQLVQIIRDDVPVSTVKAAYMIRPGVLYVRIDEWGARTHQELLKAIAKAGLDSVKSLLLDLRDNGGGYLQPALAIAGEFLTRGKLMLYIKGRHYKRENYYSERDGLFPEMPLVVLLNQNSASASEIFSGVMQDYDRAMIVGRRSFGKGLVQNPFKLKDKSEVRLTIARYYIPSGRSTQKSYGAGAHYDQDLLQRYMNGELDDASNFTPPDTTYYETLGGRRVYGGGGIFPDLFVPRDSVGYTSYYYELLSRGLVTRYAFEYVDKNRAKLEPFTTIDQLVQYLEWQVLLYKFANYAAEKGVPKVSPLLNKSSQRILRDIYSAIISFQLGEEQSIEYRNRTDLDIKAALPLFDKDGWKPKLEEKPTADKAAPAKAA